MSATEILGVCLVKNEDRFIFWSLTNIAAFCDRILVLDNHSTDATAARIDAARARFPHIERIVVDDASDTHRFVEDYAGRNLWVFGVDGDEIFDPAGLARLRPRLLAGAYDAHWRLGGGMLHVTEANFDAATGRGYGQPAAQSFKKLFNFKCMESWRASPHERLHGLKTIQFRSGWDRSTQHYLWREAGWETVDLRCLHLCFFPRSSLETAADGRKNPVEVRRGRSPLRRLERAARRVFGLPNALNYKKNYYAKGPLSTESLAGFGRPLDFADIDPQAAETEAMLLAGAP